MRVIASLVVLVILERDQKAVKVTYDAKKGQKGALTQYV